MKSKNITNFYALKLDRMKLWMLSTLCNAKNYTSYVKVLLPIALFVLSITSSFTKDLTPDMPRLIGINESFRYPEKHLLHPSLSPNEKWLVYRKLSIFSKMGNLISAFLDTTYKKMYYSGIAKNEKIALPLPQKKLNGVGHRIEWSKDGRFLALSAEIDDSRSIILIDFSGSKPHLVEYFEAEDIFHWTVENVLLYSHSSGSIMKKVPGMDPGKALSLRKGQRTYDFQLTDNGTVLFILGSSPSWRLYKTNLQNPEHRTLIFESEVTPEFIISKDGQFALVSTRKPEKPDCWNTKLYDLNTNVVNLELATHIRNARFSPDGSKLAFKEVYDPSTYTFKEGYNPSKHRIKRPHFFILDLKTKDVRDYGYGIDKHFNWTPDGDHIIYSMKCVHESGVYEYGIFVVRVSDGKEIAKLSSISSIPAPTMSRSGKYIIWEGSDRWEGPVDTFFVVKNPLDPNLFSAVK